MKFWDRLNVVVARAAAATKREEGQTMVEYGLIIALVSIALITVLGAVTGGLTTTFNSIATTLGKA